MSVCQDTKGSSARTISTSVCQILARAQLLVKIRLTAISVAVIRDTLVSTVKHPSVAVRATPARMVEHVPWADQEELSSASALQAGLDHFVTQMKMNVSVIHAKTMELVSTETADTTVTVEMNSMDQTANS